MGSVTWLNCEPEEGSSKIYAARVALFTDLVSLVLKSSVTTKMTTATKN